MSGVPPEPAVDRGLVDPHGLAQLVDRLSPGSLRAGKVALGILSVLLAPGERAASLVQGQYQGHAAVCVLTDRRVVLVNEHEWAPDIREVSITADLKVQGLQDERTASLTFITEGVGVTISHIVDRPLAHEMARLVRARVAELGQ